MSCNVRRSHTVGGPDIPLPEQVSVSKNSAVFVQNCDAIAESCSFVIVHF